jgi:hypothetical protein
MVLDKEQSKAYNAILNNLRTWGLVTDTDTSLADWLYNMIIDDKSDDYIYLDLRNQDAYKRRFPVLMEVNKKFQLGWSEANYIAQETAYRDALAELGEAGAIFATPDQFGQWMLKGIAPRQVQDRINVATNYLFGDTDPAVRQALSDQYGLTDTQMIAYLLSPEKVSAELELEFTRRTRRANTAVAAGRAGLGSLNDKTMGEMENNAYAGDFTETSRRFSNIAAEADSWKKLASYGGGDLSDDELTAEAFDLSGGGDVRRQKRKLASQERARFSGSSGLTANSLSRRGLGSS